MFQSLLFLALDNTIQNLKLWGQIKQLNNKTFSQIPCFMWNFIFSKVVFSGSSYSWAVLPHNSQNTLAVFNIFFQLLNK